MAESDQQIYDWIINADCYKKTVNQADKNKVKKAYDTGNSIKPSANIAKAAWALAKRIYAATHSGPPDPPPPPTKRRAARTYNKVLPNGSDARFCKQSPGVTIHGDGSFDDEDGNHYDTDGLHQTGPRDPNYQVPGLRLANNMNGMDPCTLYDGLLEWPKESYL